MKKTVKIFSLIAMSAFALTSCIEETFPEDSIATSDQIAASPSALEAALRGIPSQMAQGYLVYGDQVHETDMGYPAYMIAQTELLGDMYPGNSENTGYDWYKAYNVVSYNMSDNSYPSYLSWFTFYKFIKTANDIIATVGDPTAEGLTDYQKGAAGIARAYRAFNYYMSRKSSEEWEAEQSKDKSQTPIINLSSIEDGVDIHSLDKMMIFENGKADYQKISDIELCTQLDQLAKTVYDRHSVYQLTRYEKEKIAEDLYRKHHLGESQIRRCLAFPK